MPQKILALYYLIINKDLNENEIVKVNNGKGYYLIIKAFLYYFIIYLLSKKLSLIFCKKKIFFTVLFLSLLPDIFQYHSSFWNESLFFSIQLLFIYLILGFPKLFLHNVLIGLAVGLMMSVSDEYFIYIFFLTVIYLIIFKSQFLKPFLGLVLGYSFSKRKRSK